MKTRGFFVTATDTSVGKTVVSAALMHRLRAQCAPVYYKPVQTGIESDNDTETVRVLGACTPDELCLQGVSLNLPLSPHLSAQHAGVRLEAATLARPVLENPERFWIVEGAGGVMVPLNERERMIDLMAMVGLPVVLVARSGLGTLNHTLLTLKAIRDAGLEVHSVVLVGDKNPENRETLRQHGQLEHVLELPRLPQLTSDALQDWAQRFPVKARPKAALPDWVTRDKQAVWHPYMQHKSSLPIAISHGEGAYLFTQGGKRLLDATSSWWVNVHGHNHPHLNAAIARQAGRIAHVQFGNCTHAPAVELAERLLELAPPGLGKVFYSDNGSTAVETALKMAVQYWHNQGEARRTFIALHHGYHGDTFGAMSTSDLSVFTKPFAPMLFHVKRTPSPYCLHCPKDLKRPSCHVACLDELEAVLKSSEEPIAGILLEPMLQGAGGMIMWPKEYLAGAARLAKRYGTLLIADEVFTGFGRTGKMFACEHAGISPDILCVSKGLSAGYLPLAATLASEAVYQAFYSDERSRAFFHGHSFTANPLGCAVALASLELFAQNNLLERVQRLEALARQALTPLATHPGIAEVRALGAVAAIELKPQSQGGYFDPSGPAICAKLLERGLLMRPLGNVIYFMPPYVITDADAAQALDTIATAVLETLPTRP